jgi:hypothetical protein
MGRTTDVADQELDAVGEPSLCRRYTQALDARGVAVDGYDGPCRELDKVQRLCARAAAEIKHCR